MGGYKSLPTSLHRQGYNIITIVLIAAQHDARATAVGATSAAKITAMLAKDPVFGKKLCTDRFHLIEAHALYTPVMSDHA